MWAFIHTETHVSNHIVTYAYHHRFLGELKYFAPPDLWVMWLSKQKNDLKIIYIKKLSGSVVPDSLLFLSLIIFYTLSDDPA